MMRFTLKSNFFIVLLLPVLTGCDDSISLLKGKKIESGNWILVNHNYVNNTLKIIDDEAVLKANPSGLVITWNEDHNFTTCDGVLSLYKDGELVEKQNYLSQSFIHENTKIRKAYKNAKEAAIIPNDTFEYKRQWDSIRLLNKCYPTRDHMQPEDKDVIRFFSYD
jgi:hypothetical protein